MADLFGQAHLASLREDFIGLADILQDIAQLDNQFKEKCLQYRAEADIKSDSKKNRFEDMTSDLSFVLILLVRP